MTELLFEYNGIFAGNGRSYIDVIDVDHGRGAAYTAYYSGVFDGDGRQTWETNIEVPLADVEAVLGPLLDGQQNPWRRMYWP